MGWGVAGGIVAVFLVERLPMFRRDIFSRIPLLGERYAEYRSSEEDEEGNGEQQ